MTVGPEKEKKVNFANCFGLNPPIRDFGCLCSVVQWRPDGCLGAILGQSLA